MFEWILYDLNGEGSVVKLKPFHRKPGRARRHVLNPLYSTHSINPSIAVSLVAYVVCLTNSIRSKPKWQSDNEAASLSANILSRFKKIYQDNIFVEILDFICQMFPLYCLFRSEDQVANILQPGKIFEEKETSTNGWIFLLEKYFTKLWQICSLATLPKYWKPTWSFAPSSSRMHLEKEEEWRRGVEHDHNLQGNTQRQSSEGHR